MKPELTGLLKLGDDFKNNRDFSASGDGSVSFKDDRNIWIWWGKETGENNNPVLFDREKLKSVSKHAFPENEDKREEQFRNDVSGCISEGSAKNVPSEIIIHNLFSSRFTVHLHSLPVNGFLCSRNARMNVAKLFGEKTVFIQYTNPGYDLFRKVETEIAAFKEKNLAEPSITFLENQGVFIAADTADDLLMARKNVIDKLCETVPLPAEPERIPYNDTLDRVLPQIRMLLSDNTPVLVRSRNNTLFEKFCENQQEFHKISIPLIPGMIICCKPRYIYIEQSSTPERIIESFRYQLPHFISEYGYKPRLVAIKNMGLFAFDESYSAAEKCLDVYEEMVKIAKYASDWGGVRFLSPAQVSFIERHRPEPENRDSSDGKSDRNKIAIVTLSGSTFEEGIAESLFNRKYNIVLGGKDALKGNALVKKLATTGSENRAVFIETDFSNETSVKNLVSGAVKEFGGIDLFISNAISRQNEAGMNETESFDRITGENYRGFFFAVRYTADVMKLQNQGKPGYFTDMIRINSDNTQTNVSGLPFAGSAAGVTGLVRSFARELAVSGIKVNTLVHGESYDDPFWSDPGKGMLVQQFKTGKIPGARNTDDVRRFYEDQVPLRRGCRLEDIMKALLYIIGQEYETGAELKVTGGRDLMS
jgi:NAD(P)-dependent dehydrogenase (short-subunit alcohol dehydrogenase family)/rhamnose utilization protein RhaD (predicted bifunctional aldolase and dehydrogenase)